MTEIGLMLSAYIITRMVQIFALDPSARPIEKSALRVCAGVTFLLAILVMFSLLVTRAQDLTRVWID